MLVWELVQKVYHFGFCVGVVEPDGADVGGIGGVVGEFAGVEGVPAIFGEKDISYELVRIRFGKGDAFSQVN